MPHEIGRHFKCGRQLPLYRTAQPCRLLRIAIAQGAIHLPDQTENLAKDLLLRRPLLRARGLLRLTDCARFFPKLCFRVGLCRGCLLSRLMRTLACVMGRLLSRLLRRLLRNVAQMSRDDFPAGIDRLLATLFDSRIRLRAKRAPPSIELLKGGCVKSVIDPMAVPLERRAELTDLARSLRRLPILRMQRIALLLEDLVDILVLATNLFQKLSELRWIFNRLRRQLPQSTRRTFHDELRDLSRIIDRGKRLWQATGVLTQRRHGEHH